ncbi:MAG: flagellin [Anaerobiospirillum succiniciproducens]|uniref:flagellin N-terminal helical domain-containing protein n=1 Tax=Anaerobiospirillum succiniciproducens TaxID=13335 RepID=UPI0023531F28|nr:flagellin [Anaerobiospirillum succiniciproducens]MCI6864367.1 flagellin [Anaerobiospirillum succiniciproducens]MDY2798013.1 flagellin [Anaerobiospirillum succiniciproducens]
MAVYVNTNYSALQGQRYLGNVQNSLTTTYQRLSSGMRINSAKDDAAGLQIADRLTSQINGLNQGNRNAADGIALAQTIEAGMDEISGMLQKMRTLTVQAANGTNTMEDRVALSKEATALATEINRIATQTTYAGKTVLNGQSADESSLFGKAANNGGKAGLGGPDGTMTLQVGSNKGDTISFTVQSVMFSKLQTNNDLVKKDGGVVFGTDDATGAVTVRFSKADYSNHTAATGIGSAIDHLDKMIAAVDGMRANLGAIQNRLESSIRNQSNVAANEADARSRIRDADFAEESANLSQQSIIQQAAASMLMQANTRPQLGLSLLG